MTSRGVSHRCDADDPEPKGLRFVERRVPKPHLPGRLVISLPIPGRGTSIRYRGLNWRGRSLGELVERLTDGRKRTDYRAHLDPDLRQDIRRREAGWRAAFDQRGSAR